MSRKKDIESRQLWPMGAGSRSGWGPERGAGASSCENEYLKRTTRTTPTTSIICECTRYKCATWPIEPDRRCSDICENESSRAESELRNARFSIYESYEIQKIYSISATTWPHPKTSICLSVEWTICICRYECECECEYLPRTCHYLGAQSCRQVCWLRVCVDSPSD